MRNYKNAYTEVYTILNYLNEEELQKIPHEMLNMFKEKQNYNYIYEYNEELNLNDQTMMNETKAILFNIFRDYLASPEQKEKIIKMQKEYRERNEENKRNYYKENVFDNTKHKKNEGIYPIIKNEKISIFIRIKNWIKKNFIKTDSEEN